MTEEMLWTPSTSILHQEFGSFRVQAHTVSFPSIALSVTFSFDTWSDDWDVVPFSLKFFGSPGAVDEKKLNKCILIHFKILALTSLA